MKKHRFLAIFLSVFLLASAMLVACSGTGDDEGKTDKVPEVSIDYETRVKAWEEYIEYDAEAFKDAKPVDVKELNKVTGGTTNVDALNGIYVETTTTEKITELEEVPVSGTLTQLTKLERTVVKTIYKVKTYEKIASYTSKSIFEDKVVGEEFNEEVEVVEDKSAYVAYDVYALTNGIFYVTKQTYKEETITEETEEEASEEAGEELETTIYTLVKEYRYFDIDNNALSDWEEELDHDINDGVNSKQKYATVLDKTYVLNDGIIVATFDKGFELPIPYYTDAVEIGDYAYVVDEKPLQLIGASGDLTLVACPGSSVKVIDKDYNILVDYSTDADAIIGFGILSDGNVMFSQYSFLDSKATEYDAELNNIKYDIKNIIVDVKTGVATEVENTNYIISNVYTNATELLATGSTYNPNLSDGTMSFVAGGAKIKEGYFLANVQKINDKAVSNERVIAVLNNKLEIVKELPNVIENQIGYAGFSSEEGLSVKTSTTKDKLIDYYVNTKTYKVNMYMKADYRIKGGFVANGKVYNNNYVELLDLEDYNYSRVDDVLVIYDYRDDDYYDDDGYEYTVSVYVDGSSLSITQIDKDYVGYDSDIRDEQTSDYVSINGSLIVYNGETKYEMKIYDRYGKSLFTAKKPKYDGFSKYVSTYFVVSSDGSTITKIEETRKSSNVNAEVTSQTITRYSVK